MSELEQTLLFTVFTLLLQSDCRSRIIMKWLPGNGKVSPELESGQRGRVLAPTEMQESFYKSFTSGHECAGLAPLLHCQWFTCFVQLHVRLYFQSKPTEDMSARHFFPYIYCLVIPYILFNLLFSYFISNYSIILSFTICFWKIFQPPASTSSNFLSRYLYFFRFSVFWYAYKGKV